MAFPSSTLTYCFKQNTVCFQCVLAKYGLVERVIYRWPCVNLTSNQEMKAWTLSLRWIFNLQCDENQSCFKVTVQRSIWKTGQALLLIYSESQTSTRGSIKAHYLMSLMSKPQTLSQKLIFSSLYCWSSIDARYTTALSGNIRPSCYNHLSRAYNTQSSMLSYKRKYPIHSLIIMSTFYTGNSTSSTFPFIIVILSCILFFSIIFLDY